MSKDLNVTKPTPGDPGYYDYVTGTGKYAKETKLPVVTPKKAKKAVKQSGLGNKLDAYMEDDKKRRGIFSGSATDTVRKALN